MKKILLLIIISLTSILLLKAQPDWGNMLQLSGSGDAYISIPTLAGALTATDFTVEAWVKLDADASGSNAVFAINDGTASVFDVVALPATNQILLYSIDYTEPNFKYIENIDLTDRFHHFVVVYDYISSSRADYYIYIDGVLVGSVINDANVTALSVQAGYDFYIGMEMDASPSEQFKGAMDEFRVWTDVRTQAEIRYNRYIELAGTETNLTAYYQMDNVSGATLTDDSGNENTGTIADTDLVTSVASGVPLPYSGGDGTSGTPYQIETVANLVYLSQHSEDWGLNFIQTADIDFGSDETAVDWNDDGSADGSGTTGFSPIGNSTTKFTGSYNGAYHLISNLYINRSTQSFVGLFGNTASADLTQIGLISVDIVGNGAVGALVGMTSLTTVTNSFSTGIVHGSENVGGLIGAASDYLAFSIQKSYSGCSISGTTYLGGLIGANSTGVKYCYSTGSVTGTGNTDYIGGLIGYSATPNYSSSFWDVETSGQTSNGGTSGSAIGKTTAEMKTQSTFTDWDFTASTGDWQIQSENYISYPYLQGFIYDAVDAVTAVNPIPGLLVTSITWVGNTNQWHVASNWSPALVPTADIDVTIPSLTSPAFYPVIYTTTNAAVKNLNINAAGTDIIQIQQGATLTIQGEYNAAQGAKIKVETAPVY